MPQAIPAVMMAAGTGMQMYGTYQQGKMQLAMARYNAAVQKKEAERKRAQMGLVRDDAIENSRRMHKNKDRHMAKLRAQVAGAGLLEEGSVLDVYEEHDGELTQQIEDMFSSSERQAFSYKMQALGLEQRSTMTLIEGEGAMRAARFKMISQGIQGASKIAGGLK